MAVDADDVDCCEQMSHEWPMYQSLALQTKDYYLDEFIQNQIRYGAVTVRSGKTQSVPTQCPSPEFKQTFRTP